MVHVAAAGGTTTDTIPYTTPLAGLMAVASSVEKPPPSVLGTSNSVDNAPELAGLTSKDDTAYAAPATFGAITNGPPPPEQFSAVMFAAVRLISLL